MTEHVPFTDLSAPSREVRPEIDRAWERVLATGRFIGGPAVAAFEQSWAAYCGASHCVGVGNGTDALRLTLSALGIGPGDEVVVPANTFVGSVEAIVLAGATPRFADVDPDTLLLAPDALRAATTSRTAAVIVVHLYGQPADMDAVSKAATQAGLAVIEDAAQAHGATWRGQRAGSMGLAGCFSFYPAKNLGAFGDAGAVVTSDTHLARRIRSMGNHGRADGSHDRHDLAGTNSRLDALQAAVLSAKLPRLDDWTRQRRAAAARYQAALASGPVRLVPEAPLACGSWHLAVARVAARDRVREHLTAMGIQTGVHYPVPCHQQDPYRGFGTEPLPVAERAATEVLSLPMYPQITDAQVNRVCEAVAEAARLAQPSAV
jgi:dTDP-4-amino-4,6-dideoxygalactose transaminase